MDILQDSTLVLNKNFLAIRVCSVQKAIMMLYKGYCKVIDDNWKRYSFQEWVFRSLELQKNQEEEDKYIGKVHSPNLFIYSPQVIYLLNTNTENKILNEARFSRKSIFERDEYTCQYCNKTCSKNDATLDHIIPRSRGGTYQFTNIVTACRKCNSQKGNKSLDQVAMHLIRKPLIPRWRSFIGKSFSKVKKVYWQQFLE